MPRASNKTWNTSRITYLAPLNYFNLDSMGTAGQTNSLRTISGTVSIPLNDPVVNW